MTDHPAAPFDLEAVFQVDDYLYFYADMLTPERTDAEVAALVQALALDRPMRILDLACGFGRHANRLAALGHDMTGIDLIPGFLDIARRDAAERGVQVDYRQGDMRDLDFDAQFDRVMLLFTAFGYFDDAGNLQVLEHIACALKPGGLLALDVPNRDITAKSVPPFMVTEKDGNLMIDRNSFDPVTGRSTNRRIVIRNGVRRDKAFSVRLYNASEIRDLLPRAGLEVQGLYAGWDLAPFALESRRLVIVARRPTG